MNTIRRDLPLENPVYEVIVNIRSNFIRFFIILAIKSLKSLKMSFILPVKRNYKAPMVAYYNSSHYLNHFLN
jgi:hypothetical protein